MVRWTDGIFIGAIIALMLCTILSLWVCPNKDGHGVGQLEITLLRSVKLGMYPTISLSVAVYVITQRVAWGMKSSSTG